MKVAALPEGWRSEKNQERNHAGFGRKSKEEVLESMNDLRAVQSGYSYHRSVFTTNQEGTLPVVSYVEPEIFEELKEEGLKMGFRYVESGPLVRSSYHAERHLF